MTTLRGWQHVAKAMNPTDPYAFPWSQAITVLRAGLAEDVAGGDLTTNLLFDETSRARGVFRAKASGVIAGLPGSLHVFRLLNDTCTLHAHVQDGTRVTRGDVIAEVEGPTRAVLTGERLALNLLQRLSGIATLTRQCADALAGSAATLLDTRKTTPGLRALEKYAVRCGGGTNHRLTLHDLIMIKDNHAKHAGGIRKAVEQIRAQLPGARIEVETASIPEVEQALALGVDIIMLDNMDLALMREAVAVVAGRAKIEASGSIHPEQLAAVAATGVDFISMGRLTHSAPALDISMKLA